MTGVKQPDAHIPSLDGIRAIAVMLVFLAHAGLSHVVPGGFGVTLFFFLSGFLITTLLRREFEATDSISLRNFYLRRIYRIFPPMYLVLLVILALAGMGVMEGKITAPAVVAQFFHLTNYVVIYHDGHGLVPGTSVYWSLAIEEHFYLLFPLLLLSLLGRIRLQAIAGVLLLICGIVLAWRCYLVLGLGFPREFTYHATETRIDSILYGCLLALWRNPSTHNDPRFPHWLSASAFVVGISVLLFCFLHRDPLFRETLRYSLQGLALFPVFYCAVRYHNNPLFRWLDWRPLRALGQISFTFYLSHIVFLHLAGRMIEPRWASAMIAFVMTTGFSSLVYRVIELRFADLRRRLHARGASAQSRASDDGSHSEIGKRPAPSHID